MNTALSTRAHLILGLVAGSLALAGCGQRTPADRVATGAAQAQTVGLTPNGATLVLTPDVLKGGFKTQAIVAPLTTADIDHVVVSLFTLSGGFEVPVAGPDGQPLQAVVPAAELGDPVQFSQLSYYTVYRARTAAYSAAATSPADKISDDGGSYVDIHVTNDDRPALSTIPCQLDDVWFNGMASGTIDVLPGTVRYQGYPTIGVASPAPTPTAQPSASPSPAPSQSPTPAPTAAPTAAPSPDPTASPTPCCSQMGTFTNQETPDASGLRLSNFVTIDSVTGTSASPTWALELQVPSGSATQYWFNWGYPAFNPVSPSTPAYDFGSTDVITSWTPGSIVTVQGPTAGSSITLTLGASPPTHAYQDNVSIL